MHPRSWVSTTASFISELAQSQRCQRVKDTTFHFLQDQEGATCKAVRYANAGSMPTKHGTPKVRGKGSTLSSFSSGQDSSLH